jgi:hypothetical protein
MPENLWMMRIRAPLIIGAFACALAVAPAAAEDEDEPSFEESLIQGILGGKSVTRPDIDYRERSPLVVPPSRDLPPPDSGNFAAGHAAWPKDADIERREKEKKAARHGFAFDQEREAARPLRPDELRKGARAGAGRVTSTQPSVRDADASSRPLPPSELGYKGGVFGSIFSKGQGDQAPFTGEPERATLTQPPVGYQTPSPSHPYGVQPEKPKGPDWLKNLWPF